MKSVGYKIMAVAAILAVALAIPALGTALSANANTPERTGKTISLTQASNHIYAGSIVCEKRQHVCRAGLGFVRLRGRGPGGSGTRQHRGELFLDADDGDSARSLPMGERWKLHRRQHRDYAYVADDQTVTTAASATNDVVAGVIVDVDSDGVWVDTFAVGGSGAASFTTVSATGAANLQSTLAVGGASTFTGPITGAAAITGATIRATGTIGLTNGWFKISGTNLQFITAAGVTNILDADLTTP